MAVAEDMHSNGAGRDLAAYDPQPVWDSLQTLKLNSAHVAKHRLISATRRDPAYVMIDMLRTRLWHALHENGWKRVAITAPTHGCGSSFVAANLAVSMARGDSRRVVLMDMDLRGPYLSTLFGAGAAGRMAEYLSGMVMPEDFLVKLGRNLALGFNGVGEKNAAEILLENTTADVLREMHELMMPDVVLYDMPPALEHDDLVAFLPQVDGVLLVVGGGVTTADQVRATEALLDGKCPLLATVLNFAEGDVAVVGGA